MRPSSWCPLCAAGTPGAGARGSWIQVNLALPENAGRNGQLAAAVDLLDRRLAGARGAGFVRRAFVQRKDPGLRVRVEWRRDVVPVRARLRAALTDLRRGGMIARCTTSVYEPEAGLFGGRAAMGALHDQFDVDTRVMARWHRLASKAPPPCTIAVFSLAALNDLFFTALEGRREEIWDVWCRLAACHAGAPAAGNGRLSSAPAARALPVVGLDRMAALAADARWRRLLLHAAAANRRLARRLLGLWARGRLRAGLRAVLATAALFHWNRHGLPTQVRARLYGGMQAALSPHGDPDRDPN